jgi:TP901-1 family phage major tail protein
MAKQKGRTMLVKISDGAGAFTAFAGLTSKTLKINNERIDATTPDAANPEGVMWRETLDGVKSLSVSGDYTLVEHASEARLVEAAISPDAVDDFEVVVPGLGTFEGTFSVEVEFSGDGVVTGSMSLESTGAITFTPAA